MTLDMQKEDTLIFLKMGEKNLEKTHAMSLNVCDDNMQDQGRLRNLGVGKHFGGCCSRITLGNTLVKFELLCLG